jgi:hypothetical protein
MGPLSIDLHSPHPNAVYRVPRFVSLLSSSILGLQRCCNLSEKLRLAKPQRKVKGSTIHEFRKGWRCISGFNVSIEDERNLRCIELIFGKSSPCCFKKNSESVRLMFKHLAHFLCALSELFLKFPNQLIILAFCVGEVVVC